MPSAPAPPGAGADGQAVVSGDPALATLRAELAALPGGQPPSPDLSAAGIAIPLRLHDGAGGELAFISTVTTFGTALDVTVSELSIEAFFPADAATAQRLRALAPA